MTETETVGAGADVAHNECEQYCWCTRVDGHSSAVMRWTPEHPVMRFPVDAEAAA